MNGTKHFLTAAFGGVSLAYAVGSYLRGGALGGETTLAGLVGLLYLGLAVAGLLRDRKRATW